MIQNADVVRIVCGSYNAYLCQVFAYDTMMQDTARASMITHDAQEAVKGYSRRFRSAAAQVARNVGGQVIGGALPGGPSVVSQNFARQAFAQGFNLFTDLSLGLIKFSEAEDDFAPKLRDAIKRAGLSTPHTREMMRMDLLRDSNPVVKSRALEIMETLDATEFVTMNSNAGGVFLADINYSNCAQLKTINLGAFSSISGALVESCELPASLVIFCH